MNRVLILSVIFCIASCGQENEPTLHCDENICDSLTCTGTMGVKVKDERGYTIVGAEVYFVGAKGNLFDSCITLEGGENHHDETGYHWHNGCDLRGLPLDTPFVLNVVVNGITSMAEVDDFIISSVDDTPHTAAFISLEEGQY